MKAYILLKTRTGEIRDVVKLARRVAGVKECSMTFGPYDAVAIVEADDVQRIGRIIATEIQPIPGIVETLTCLAIEIG
jgi:DNA-binding Lrp family transcriptional regulator